MWSNDDNMAAYEAYVEYKTKLAEDLELIKKERKSGNLKFPTMEELGTDFILSDAYKLYVEEEKELYLKRHPNSKYRVEE